MRMLCSFEHLIRRGYILPSPIYVLSITATGRAVTRRRWARGGRAGQRPGELRSRGGAAPGCGLPRGVVAHARGGGCGGPGPGVLPAGISRLWGFSAWQQRAGVAAHDRATHILQPAPADEIAPPRG